MAQNQKIDSLANVLKRLPEGSDKIQTLNSIATEWLDIALDSAEFYLGQSLELGQNFGFSNQQADIQFRLASRYYQKHRLSEAITHFQHSHQLYLASANDKRVADACYSLGAIYSSLGEFE
ncbi:MAG: hypothetical protein AAFP02_09940, partial [Bacteroidota bacterium]